MVDDPVYLVEGVFLHYGGWQLLPASVRAACEHMGNDILQNGFLWGQNKVH